MRSFAATFFFAAALFVSSAHADPKTSTAQPNVHVLAPMAMPELNRERTIRIYLPPGYEQSKARYPVVYMHDGQNLFDDATSYLGEWQVDEALNALSKSEHLNLIVVGIDNGLDRRVRELDPWDSAQYGKGEGAQYAAFIVKTLKPYIDAHYRTKSDRAHTAIMGSSLGGLISHYAIAEYPDVFGKAGIFSPAYWFAPPVFEFSASHIPPHDARLYFYAGGKEHETMVPNVQRVVAGIRAAGFPGKNLRVEVNPDAPHNETAWRAEFPRAIAWLFDGTR